MQDVNEEYTDAKEIGRFLGKVRNEVRRARGKFPTNEDQLAALGEEKGELTKALLEHKYGNTTSEDVYHEAVQTAAMALRVALEGDHSFPYDPETINS